MNNKCGPEETGLQAGGKKDGSVVRRKEKRREEMASYTVRET